MTEPLRPKLKPVVTSQTRSRLLLECASAPHPVVLPLSAAVALPLLDGTRTVQQVVDQLYRQHGRVEFKQLFSTIEKLGVAGFFEGASGGATPAGTGRAPGPAGRQPLFFRRALLQRSLVRRLGSGRAIPALFALLAIGTLAAAAAALVFPGASSGGARVGNGFLRLGGGYGHAVPYLVAATSALLSARALWRTLLLMLATGRAFGLGVELAPVSISLAIDDVSLNLSERGWIPALFALASAASTIALAGVASAIAPGLDPGGSLLTIAGFLCLQELSPHARSSLTRYLALRSPEAELARLAPSLRDRALFTFVRGYRGEQDGPVLRYAGYAILWTGAFLAFTDLVATRNFPSLVLALQGTDILGAICALPIAVGLALFTAWLHFDLVRTLSGNLLYPIRALVAAVLRELRSRKEGKPTDDTILKALKSSSLFRGIGGPMLDRLVGACAVRSYPRGVALLIQGRGNENLYILLEGATHVLRRIASGERSRLAELEAGAVFGEISALEGSPATADVVTAGPCRVLEIPRKIVRATSADKESSPDLEQISAKVMLGHCIASSQLFRGMPAELAGFLGSRGTLRTVPAGTVLIQQGDDDRTLHLLVRGRAEVAKDGTKVAELGQGGFFGEIALLSGEPRTASVTAAEECVVLSLHADDVWGVLTKNPGFSLLIESVAESRREADAKAVAVAVGKPA